MPYYRCTVVTSAGKKTAFTKEAANEHELAASFNDSDHILVKYAVVADSAIAHSKKNYNSTVILEFTEIMTSLLKSGLTVQDAVTLCASIAADRKQSGCARVFLERCKADCRCMRRLKCIPRRFLHYTSLLSGLANRQGL